MSGISRALCLVVALGCGFVLLSVPSEVDDLAVVIAIGRPAALALLAVITAGSLIALISCRCPKLTAAGLASAAAALFMYGVLAVAIKGGVALPTAALAVGVSLRYAEIAGELRARGFLHRDPA